VVLLATTSEVSTLSERRRQSAIFEWDTLAAVTDRPYFEHPQHCSANFAFLS
jgi:hypothetical protein